MLVRNPYGTNLDVIVNDEYLKFQELFSEDTGRVFPPFFPQDNQPEPSNFNPNNQPEPSNFNPNNQPGSSNFNPNNQPGFPNNQPNSKNNESGFPNAQPNPQNNQPEFSNFNSGTLPPPPPRPGSHSNPNSKPNSKPNSNPNSYPGPPPSYTPKQTTSQKNSNSGMLKVSPGSISPCKYQYVYVWQTNGTSYWAWFTRIDRTTASGYRWNGYRWIYFGVDLNKIESFECYGRKPYRNIDNVVENLETQILSPTVFKLEYPFINNIVNEDVENIINAEIIDTLDNLLQNQVLVPEKVNFKNVESAYEVPLDSYGILSIVMSISTLVQGEKKPRITFDSLTIDLNTGEIYDFQDLFNKKSDYQQDINSLAMEIAKKLNAKIVVPYEGITNGQKYYLTPEELVLYYQVDEYTPASQGLFRIPIPYTLITKYLSTQSPIYNIINPSNLINVPPTSNATPSPVPAEEGGTAMGPEYLGTYTGEVPKK